MGGHTASATASEIRAHNLSAAQIGSKILKPSKLRGIKFRTQRRPCDFYSRYLVRDLFSRQLSVRLVLFARRRKPQERCTSTYARVYTINIFSAHFVNYINHGPALTTRTIQSSFSHHTILWHTARRCVFQGNALCGYGLALHCGHLLFPPTSFSPEKNVHVFKLLRSRYGPAVAVRSTSYQFHRCRAVLLQPARKQVLPKCD